jgi:hypothetical protein
MMDVRMVIQYLAGSLEAGNNTVIHSFERVAASVPIETNDVPCFVETVSWCCDRALSFEVFSNRMDCN